MVYVYMVLILISTSEFCRTDLSVLGIEIFIVFVMYNFYSTSHGSMFFNLKTLQIWARYSALSVSTICNNDSRVRKKFIAKIVESEEPSQSLVG